ncbi:hypothetical protein ABB08_23405 [Paenibacillus larvae]|nr:hypothetical protein [Paenibacillus larvae]
MENHSFPWAPSHLFLLGYYCSTRKKKRNWKQEYMESSGETRTFGQKRIDKYGSSRFSTLIY